MNKQTLASKLRSARERKGWSQRQLADAAGVSQGAVNGIETGRRLRPTADVMCKLARAMGVKVESLM